MESKLDEPKGKPEQIEKLLKRHKRFMERAERHAVRHYKLLDELGRINELARKYGLKDGDLNGACVDNDLGDYLC